MQEGNPLLAYVFWHCQQAEIAATGYENRQRAFHAVLAAVPSSGFLGSFSMRLSHVPRASRVRERLHRHPCAFQLRSWMTVGGVSSRNCQCRLTCAGP
jgi:hypothetical protein